MRRILLSVLVLMAVCVLGVASQQEDLSLVEVGSLSTLNSASPPPMQDVARLLVQAHRNIQRLNKSRNPYNVLSNHIKVRKHTTLQLGRAANNLANANANVPQVNAQLVPRMAQPRIHDAHKWGTRNPVDQKPGQWVDASIVGEDGKPFIPRKQHGITDEPETFLSPFAKFIHPPAVGSSADVTNVDPNTKLTPLELKHINSLQLRLKKVLDQLGANIVWDHGIVRNRRLISEFNDLKVESRALMEEYELRTGVKTIAWQLGETDLQGLDSPDGAVTDIHFAKNPELAGRELQRGFQKGPPAPSAQMIANEKKRNEVPKPKEQIVNVAWKKQSNGVVKAKIGLRVVDSKVPLVDQPANMAARLPVAGKKYPSGRTGSPSLPVQIDVVAPSDEELVRNKNMLDAAPKPEAAEPKKN